MRAGKLLEARKLKELTNLGTIRSGERVDVICRLKIAL